MAGLRKDEARLTALNPEAVREQRGILVPSVRRVGVDLGVQSLQFVCVRGGLGPVEQTEREVGRRHVDIEDNGGEACRPYGRCPAREPATTGLLIQRAVRSDRDLIGD
jgi:hypothetical protein